MTLKVHLQEEKQGSRSAKPAGGQDAPSHSEERGQAQGQP